MAFRNVPLRKLDWSFLVIKARHPLTGKWYYFVDKCLPFGASISCAIFQEVSDAIAYVVISITHKPLLNYLDDFLFVALLRIQCNAQVNTFLAVCMEIGFPVAIEKTYWGSMILVFLSLLLDVERQLVCVLKEKVVKALDLIQYFVDHKKVTVKHIRCTTGYLNFLCRCIIPGHAFLHRMYTYTSSKMKSHYHVKVTNKMKQDLAIWQVFLLNPIVYCRPFMEFGKVTAEDILMYSNASRSAEKGMGAICQDSWMYKQWNKAFL